MGLIFAVTGAISVTVLVSLLLCTLLAPQVRFWPLPLAGSWQSVVFWSTFRMSNFATFATAIATSGGWLEIPVTLRVCALAVLLIAGGAYLFSLLALGKPNTYCGRDGLVTHGIYRWTRNPQYATVIPVYIALGVVADSLLAAVLCAAMILAYILMALTEEPWLEAAYGDTYRHYCRKVPRFLNWTRFKLLGHALWRKLRRQLANREQRRSPPPMMSSRG